MRGKAYAIKFGDQLVAISLSRLNAQEILMDYAFEDGAWIYSLYVDNYGHNRGLREANETMSKWHISDYDLV